MINHWEQWDSGNETRLLAFLYTPLFPSFPFQDRLDAAFNLGILFLEIGWLA